MLCSSYVNINMYIMCKILKNFCPDLNQFAKRYKKYKVFSFRMQLVLKFYKIYRLSMYIILYTIYFRYHTLHLFSLGSSRHRYRFNYIIFYLTCVRSAPPVRCLRCNRVLYPVEGATNATQASTHQEAADEQVLNVGTTSTWSVHV